MVDRFYIDCEFDGHGGQLMSFAMVREDGFSVHITTDAIARDPWVLANVVPLLDSHDADLIWTTEINNVGTVLHHFMEHCERPVIVADSPVDIGRFCTAITTNPNGGWASAEYSLMTFEVHNVDCWPNDIPGAVQHNAYWDAMALRHKLAALSQPTMKGA